MLIRNKAGLSVVSPSPIDAASQSPTKIETLYSAQRDTAIACLRRFSVDRVPSQSDVDELAGLLHKLAGTAAYFGEELIGEEASELERDLRSAATNEVFNFITKYRAIVVFAALAANQVDPSHAA